MRQNARKIWYSQSEHALTPMRNNNTTEFLLHRVVKISKHH